MYHSHESAPRRRASLSGCAAFACLLLAASAARAPLGAQRAAASSTPTDTVRLSIEDAVLRGVRSSDEARQAEARVDVAEAGLVAARASALPQLRLNGSYNHVYESARGQAVGALFNQPNTYSVAATLGQPLFQGGRAVAGLRAAGALRQSARFDQRETQAELSLGVQRAYLGVLLATRLYTIQEANLALSDARVRQVEELAKGGRASRYDVLRARVERTNQEPLLLQARADAEVAMLTLKGLLNIPANQPVVLTSQVTGAEVTALVDSAAASGASDSVVALRQRASVRALELTATARRAAIWVARADLLPTVSLNFNTGYQAYPLSGFPNGTGATTIVPTTCRFVTVDGSGCTASSQNGGWFSDRSLGVTVSWPIFDGLRTKGNVDLAQAQARLAELELSQERERVVLETAQARAELERTRSLYAANQQNAAEADTAFQLASLRFSRGLGTQLDVSDAQLALLTAQSNQARATYDLYLATAGLARALGRPIPLPPTTAAAVTVPPPVRLTTPLTTPITTPTSPTTVPPRAP